MRCSLFRCFLCSHKTIPDYTILKDSHKWTQSTITYALSPHHTIDYMNQDDIKSVIRRSFARWAIVTPLNFIESSDYDKANIKIGFYTRGKDGGDQYPFEFRDVIAEGGNSSRGGFIHLNKAFNFVNEFGFKMPSLSDAHLETTLIHEIGHVLGLGHSRDNKAVMSEYQVFLTKKVELTLDDILGIQSLYGCNPNFVMPPLNSRMFSRGVPSS